MLVRDNNLFEGTENLLKDSLGNLPFDVKVAPFTNTDHPSYRHRVEVIQGQGEIIFIPSGWHHQVHNLVSLIKPFLMTAKGI